MNQKIFKLLTLALVCLIFSCEEKKVKLQPSDILRIDTMYNAQSKLLKEELDSLCKTSYEERFNKAVDSIMNVRLEERKKRLGF